MKKVPACTSWGLVVAAVSLSPIVLIFGLPLSVGIGLDIFEHAGKGPFVLALSIPVAFALLRQLSPLAQQWVGALASRPHLPLSHSAKPN
ncbi:MAG TPA: hypothetical protein VGQ90_08745 [Stellaceae bacterium]|jgi:hypothetical protein|nr:hypothetical protein [Stellaceae bacterium]